MPFTNDAQIQAAMQKVFKKAGTDAAFRKLCLSNAAAAVKQATGEDIPKGFKLRFVDNAGANLTIVLPDPPRAGGELKDEEPRRSPAAAVAPRRAAARARHRASCPGSTEPTPIKAHYAPAHSG